MTEYLLLGVASILVLGITAQWLAWRIRLPSILLLLIFGFIAGPITGFLDPDEIFGELLFTLVSVSVALILFEGGLRLRINELRQTRRVVRNLITIGILVTWCLSSIAAYFILDFDVALALLFGAILVVTGPTVIIPLLRDVRAVGKINAIIKWEGIVNDPIGAMLAVLVFEAIITSGFQATALTIALSILKTIFSSLILGGVGALLLILLLKRHWVPGYLQTGVTIMVVLAAFTASNLLQAESGLFTVTLMGVILANQKQVSVRHIIEFKENLGILLLSGLFIVLAARLEPAHMARFGWSSFAFLAFMVIIVRPMCVFFSTLTSNLNWREKLFLAWMAPRGVVAAAVTAIFALELAETAGYEEAELMVPEMFFVIVGTVAIYGLSAAPLGRWLDVARPNPQGVLIVGAQDWARTIAKVLWEEGYEILLVDTNRENINAARLEGLPTFYASVLSEYIVDEIELGSLGRLLALTANDEVNALASLHFAEIFDRTEVYQLSPKKAESKRKETVSSPLRGRLLFETGLTYADLSSRFAAGATIKKTKLTEKFDYKAFKDMYGTRAISFFLIRETGRLSIFTVDKALNPQPGDMLISLIDPQVEDASLQVAAHTQPEASPPASYPISSRRIGETEL